LGFIFIYIFLICEQSQCV